jgi:hypothetical protein
VDWNSYFTPSVDKSDVDASPGDTLRFTWTGAHNVYIMHQTAWDNCDFTGATDLGSTSPLDFVIPTSATVGIKLWFGCEMAGHCSSGQKNEVDIVSGPSPAPTPEPASSSAVTLSPLLPTAAVTVAVAACQ